MLAWVTVAISKQHVKPRICHIRREREAQSDSEYGARLHDIFMGSLEVGTNFITISGALLPDECCRMQAGLKSRFGAKEVSESRGKAHTPRLLTESLGWHNRYLRTGMMRPREED